MQGAKNRKKEIRQKENKKGHESRNKDRIKEQKVKEKDC